MFVVFSEASVGTYTLFAATVDRLAIPSGVEHDLSGLNRLQGPKMFDAVVWGKFGTVLLTSN
ncbi:hypothetical protein T265_12281 [Opisthorchis viverrini]|uniref:Uncharacterized protein n=1 Tax=Opisthorchis viverrini TaxID=6198 RepID=A0A074ZT21_OPIVI|nr:hypothetical protein T265_12281 [Opisthorchis viverrini]KER18414.1 hypothetical protein T265_12281 [Opisthorchis viverrini]